MICGAPCVILPFFPMAARVRSLRRTTPPFSPRQAISEARAGVNLPLDPQPSLLSPFNHDPFCIPSASSFSPSSTCSMSSKAFLNTITARRSIYQLNRQLPDGVTDASIQELVKEVIKQTPSAVRAFLRRCRACATKQPIASRSYDACDDEIEADAIPSLCLFACRQFNNQTARALVLFGNEHQKLWDLVRRESISGAQPSPRLGLTVRSLGSSTDLVKA
jgi:hypothetical protein